MIWQFSLRLSLLGLLIGCLELILPLLLQLLCHVQLFITRWTIARQASLSFTTSWSLLKLLSIESVMPSKHLSLSPPYPLALNLSEHQIFFFFFFFKYQVFTSGGQNIGMSASASVLPMNIQGWFTLGLTSLNPLKSKGLSRVFSSTTVQKHQFFGAQTSLWSNSQNPYMIIGKVIALTIAFTICRPFSAKWCLCFLIHCLGLS